MPEAIFVLIGAAVTVLLAIYINSFFLKPVFDIDISACRAIYDPYQQLWLYTLVVKNVGLRAANNCIGTMSIENVKKEDIHNYSVLRMISMGGSLESLLRREDFPSIPANLESENIPWLASLGETSFSTTINKEATAKLVLFSIAPGQEVDENPVLLIEPSVKDKWRVALIAHREYEGIIKITANNANPRTIRFSIELDEENQLILKVLNVIPKTKGRWLRQICFGQ